MQSRSNNFYFGFNYKFGVDSVFRLMFDKKSGVIPPPVSNFLLLDNTPFLLLDTTNFLLL